MKKILIFVFLIFIACSDEGGFLALNSKPINLQYDARNRQLKGLEEPFMLFFYSKDCGVCAEQIPILNELKNDIKIIGVLGGVKDYIQAKDNLKGVEFATIYEPLDVEYLSNVVGGIYGVPAIFLYDKNGRMSKKFISLTPKSVLQKEIRLLKD